ncbi:MAG: MFS transporter [Acidimicrobiia bacterium]|nr:MFS transporter [Acidimicrobiia bacterium]NNF63559.1 MFS transporter [Acidimicrobiia bacterium]
MVSSTARFSTSPTQRRALIGIAGSQLLVLTLWFSAAAVAPQLEEVWSLDSGGTAALTLAVQIGFVLGALGSAVANLADLVPSRRLFVVAGLFGAAVNGSLVMVDGDSFAVALTLRLLTGVALAGVYPSGLKVMAGWFTKGRGMALGVLVGALTVGSAGPHLIRGLGVDWQGVVLGASALAIVGVVVMAVVVTDGPHETAPSRFAWNRIGSVLRNRGVRLATYGYLGHMWELYAMWTWTAVFLAASARASGSSTAWVSNATFVVIAVGGIGAWAAGSWADRYGRTIVAGGAMAVSGGCALASPLVFGAPPVIVVTLFVVWGFTVVADSAQFSAIVTETAADAERGTALTLQTAVGFLLTLVTIRGVPLLADLWGWQWAFPILAIGPILGIAAMARLRGSSESAALAGGRG